MAPTFTPYAADASLRVARGTPDASGFLAEQDLDREAGWQRMGVLARKIEGSEPITRSGSEDSEDEAALLAHIAAGEAGAFRVLLDRHLSLALGIARRMLRDEAEAEDIAQEAMLRLWRHAASLDLGAGGVRPWLRRVVSNLCIDRVRSARNTALMENVPEMGTPASQVRELAEQDLATRVGTVLQTLPERQRLALTLFHYEGMSQIEVGEVLGVSDEAVESLLARARRAMKAALKEEWQALMPEADIEPQGAGKTDGD